MTKIDRLVLSKPDTRFVACSDPAERDGVRENFLKTKLGLSGNDLDASIKSVCEAMNASPSKYAPDLLLPVR